MSGFDDFLVPDAKTADEANAVLKRYMPGHNRRFSIPAAESSPAWRRVRASMDIVRTCAFHYQATVFNDNTVRLQGQIIDIPPGRGGRGYAKKQVEVVQLLEGTWRVYWKDELIAPAEATVVDELRVRRRRKRSASDRAFGRAIQHIAASLP